MLVTPFPIVTLVKTDTRCKRPKSNARNAVGDDHAGQPGVKYKRLISDSYNTVSDGHTGQTVATTKCIIPNARNTIGDGRFGQSGAKCKRHISNTCNAVFQWSRWLDHHKNEKHNSQCW